MLGMADARKNKQNHDKNVWTRISKDVLTQGGCYEAWEYTKVVQENPEQVCV